LLATRDGHSMDLDAICDQGLRFELLTTRLRRAHQPAHQRWIQTLSSLTRSFLLGSAPLALSRADRFSHSVIAPPAQLAETDSRAIRQRAPMRSDPAAPRRILVGKALCCRGALTA
jgi:hypothetical protein